MGSDGMAAYGVDLASLAPGVLRGNCELYVLTYAFFYAVVLWLFNCSQSSFLNFNYPIYIVGIILELFI